MNFMDELSIPWSIMIHPDMEAIKRRDEILLNAPDYIQNQDGSIIADIEVDFKSETAQHILYRDLKKSKANES